MLHAIICYLFISAGIYMKKAREEDPEFTYKTYLIEMNDGMGVSPVADAARELAWSDKWLKKVGQQVVLV